MNYEKSNGKRRKLYTSINNSNNGNQLHDAVLASQIRNINKISTFHSFFAIKSNQF